MSLVIDAPARGPKQPRDGRKSWRRRLIGVLVLAVMASGIGWFAHWEYYRHHYQPLEFGNISGDPLGAVKALTDGIHDPSEYIITGGIGSTGTFRWSLRNHGSHAVRVLSVKRPLLLADIRVTWSPIERPGPDGIGILGGDFKHAAPLPVTIQPGKEISLFVTVTKRACARGFIEQVDALDFTTEALGVHHTWTLDLNTEGDFSPQFAPIAACSPKSALQHISKY